MIKHLSPKTPEELAKADEFEKRETIKFIEKHINSYKKTLPKKFIIHTSGQNFKILNDYESCRNYDYFIYTYNLFGRIIARNKYKLVLKKAGNKYSVISIEKLLDN